MQVPDLRQAAHGSCSQGNVLKASPSLHSWHACVELAPLPAGPGTGPPENGRTLGGEGML
eukprot:1159288-Pelagomonas_calceolata.AAC.4